MCVNETINNICCSPIYNTYLIQDIDPIFVKYIILKYLNRKRNKFTNKSTRREYEIVPKDLERMKIPFISYENSIYESTILKKYEKYIDLLKKKIKLIKKTKLFYLNNLFI